MVTRKKTARKPRSGDGNGGDEARALAVVIEEQRAHFKVFGEALQGLREEMNGRFTEMNGRFTAMNGRFTETNARFEAVDRRFDGVDRELSFVKTAVLETSREMKELRRTVADLDARKANRDEVGLQPGE